MSIAYSAGRFSSPVLGIFIPSVLGTVFGLLPAFLVSSLILRPSLSASELATAAAGVLIVSGLSEKLAELASHYRRRIVVVGKSQGGLDLIHELAAEPRSPFECLGIVDEEVSSMGSSAGVPLLGNMAELPEIIETTRPDLVVFAGGTGLTALNHLFSETFESRVIGIWEFYEHAFGRVPVAHLSPAWFLSMLHLKQRLYPDDTKRLVDVTLACLAITLSAPLFPIVACLVRLSGPGPIVLRQTRVGKAGRQFRMFKFRTMVADAEAPGMPVWAQEDDERVTSIGRYLRMTRLDELPQFWNVLRGDMSFVGPRPERPELSELLRSEIPFWNRRHGIRPGIAGWAQVRQGYAAGTEASAQKLSYDLFYLKHRNTLLDLIIVAKTPWVLLSGLGAR